MQPRVQQKTRNEYEMPPEAVRTGTPSPSVRPRIARVSAVPEEAGRFGEAASSSDEPADDGGVCQ